MSNIRSTRATTVTLKDVVLDHVRLGAAYVPNFEDNAGDLPQWSVQARVNPKDNPVTAGILLDLKEAGVAVNHDEESGDLTLNLKQYTQTREGKDNEVIVLDANNEVISEEDRPTIGNGSKGSVVFYHYAFANASGVGQATRLVGVKVDEKVEFTPETNEERIKRLFSE